MAGSPQNYQTRSQHNTSQQDRMHQNGYLSDSDEEYSSSEMSDSSDGEPGWEEEALKSGELFYVEQSQEHELLNEQEDQRQADKENSLIYNYAKPRFKLAQESLQTKTVLINVESATTYEINTKTTLLAAMLGIIMLDRSSMEADLHDEEVKHAVTVDALVPGGIALRCGQINLGDIMYSINDSPVNTSNIEAFLRRITRPTCLKLVLHTSQKLPRVSVLSPQEIEPVSSQFEPQTNDYACISTLLTPHASRQNRVYSLNELHGVFYLTLKVNSETAAEFDDVLYSFPSVEAAIAPSKLAQIRGLFLTLSDLMKQSLSTRVLSTTLSLGDETFHCAHFQVNTELLLLCFPGCDYSLPQVHLSLANAVRLLTIMYGSLQKAFQPENKQRLDHMFHYFLFLNAAKISNKLKGNYAPKIPGVLQLVLPDELQAQANSTLAELEASDFDDGSSASSYSRRLYSVLGTCLFYDGYMVANHLSKEDLSDVHLFCHNHNLLAIREKERIGLLVIWREVHRWTCKIGKTGNDFSASPGRYFLLIVGLKRSLLCTVLQLNGKLFPATHTPRPDTKFVDSAKAILINLESSRFFASLSYHIVQPSILKIIPADQFLSSHSKSLFGSSKPPLGDTAQSGRFRLRISSPLKVKAATSDTDDDKLTTPKKGTSSDKPKLSHRVSRSLFREKTQTSQGSTENLVSPRTTKEIRPNVSVDNLKSQISGLQIVDSQVNITAGSGCSLFCYMKFDTLKGALIMPTDAELSSFGDFHHREILANFRKYSLILHQRLKSSNGSGDDCIEEGILFQYRPFKDATETKRSSHFLQYWVIGRVLQHPYPHEFFVCFHNSAPQSTVELAFKSAVF